MGAAPDDGREEVRRLALLAAAVVAGAFCLFLVQPLLAKQLLPLFGGTAAVWAVCMVFYQGLLLAGYLYAHALAKYLRPRVQAQVHAALIFASLLALPISLPQGGQPVAGRENPGGQILIILLRAVGLPYFVLSATSPLMQAWAARLEAGRRAYRLFGWSNLSCAAALLSFPFALEPWIPIPQLNLLWSGAYLASAAALLGAALFVIVRNPRLGHEEKHGGAAPSVADRLRWIGYAALGTTLLVGTTNHLCQMVAPIPFLWTVPLLAYLLTFVVVFEREWYRRPVVMSLAGAAAAGMAWSIVYLPAGKMIGLGVPVFVGGCFLVCLYCHGELAARKPEPAHLTEFYILMAAGGALGSLFIAFGAPALFRSHAELPVALAMVGLLILFSAYRRHSTAVDMAAACCAVMTLSPAYAYLKPQAGHVEGGRNFFGALRVKDEPARDGLQGLRKIYHGGTSHGAQFLDPARSGEPAAYYGPRSAPGVWFRHTQGPRNVGVIGLGAGTLAAYARAGDRMKFYEINPLVVDYARRHFTYMAKCAGTVSVVVGDGRKLLESEPPNNFDLLILDAFSDDSIPTHLLTREAFALYLRHLKAGGMLAFHVSNRYLELQPMIWRLGRAAGMRSVALLEPGDPRRALLPASWALVGREKELRALPVNPDAYPEFRVDGPVWSDSHSSLLAALN